MGRSTLSEEEIRRNIISAAREEFLAKGISGTEMKIIAEKSNVGRTTLYRYFPIKEQIALVLSNDIFQQISVRCLFSLFEPGRNGYDRLHRYSLLFAEALAENVVMSQYLQEFDVAVVQDDSKTFDALPEKKAFQETIEKHNTAVNMCIAEGKSDGSIRADVDAQLFAVTLFDVLFGVANRTATRVRRTDEDQGPRRAIIINAVEGYLSSIHVDTSSCR